MKDKAEVLLELERLTVVKEELTEEVANLHKLLEQERSNKNPQHGNQTDVHAKHAKEKVVFFVAYLCYVCACLSYVFSQDLLCLIYQSMSINFYFFLVNLARCDLSLCTFVIVVSFVLD